MTSKMSKNEIIIAKMLQNDNVYGFVFIVYYGDWLLPLERHKPSTKSANMLEMVTCTNINPLKNNSVMCRQYK